MTPEALTENRKQVREEYTADSPWRLLRDPTGDGDPNYFAIFGGVGCFDDENPQGFRLTGFLPEGDDPGVDGLARLPGGGSLDVDASPAVNAAKAGTVGCSGNRLALVQDHGLVASASEHPARDKGVRIDVANVQKLIASGISNSEAATISRLPRGKVLAIEGNNVVLVDGCDFLPRAVIQFAIDENTLGGSLDRQNIAFADLNGHRSFVPCHGKRIGSDQYLNCIRQREAVASVRRCRFVSGDERSTYFLILQRDGARPWKRRNTRAFRGRARFSRLVYYGNKIINGDTGGYRYAGNSHESPLKALSLPETIKKRQTHYAHSRKREG